MIIDSIDNAERYNKVHPLFEKAFDFLKKASSMPDGRYEIDGDKVYVMISENNLRDQAELEAHRKYIDIQLVISGSERFRCASVDSCKSISKSYDDKADIMFFSDDNTMEYAADEGIMSVFFPSDAHAPLIGNGKVRKAIAKIKVL